MPKRIRSQAYLKWQRETKAELYRARRAFALDFLGGKCTTPNCDSTDRLEIDHKNRSEKSFPISRPPNEQAFRKELLKCQLLCYDCHREKSAREHSGEASPLAKLTADQVSEIRTLLEAGAIGRALAKRFGVCPMQISRIKNRKRWRRET